MSPFTDVWTTDHLLGRYDYPTTLRVFPFESQVVVENTGTEDADWELRTNPLPAMSIHISRWRAFPIPLNPGPGQPFVMRVQGRRDNDCPPTLEEVEVLDTDLPTLRIELRESFAQCEETPEHEWTLEIPVPGLTTGTYMIEVERDPRTGGPLERAATSEVAVVAPGSARLTELTLQPAASGHGQDVSVAFDGPIVLEASPPRVVGRNILLDLTPPQGTCCATGATSLLVSAGDLEPGPYRVIARSSDPATDEEPQFLAQSPELIEVRRISHPFGKPRFRASLTWQDHQGNTGTGFPVSSDGQSSMVFAFFSGNNWELLVKVLDGCKLNGHHWVFGSASTDVSYTLTLEDTQTGEVRAYENPLGKASPAITDTRAFPCTNDER